MTHTREQSGASGVRALIRQHSITTFFLFTFLITWAGESFLILLVELPAMSVLYTWVFQHTAGSALLAILFHVAVSWLRQVPAGNRRRLAGAR